MSGEIKSRYGGRVLYTAENATDVRAVLREAVAAGADLAGAYLAGANLAGANLADAYLADAYLAGADLAGAYLAGAYLAGANLADANLAGADLADANLAGANLADANLADANLAGANLAGANLADANLAGANLADANLAGANLAGANLADAIWEEVASALETALQAMNDSGRHWIKGALTQRLEDGSQAYCAVGSVQASSEGTVQAVALWLLASVTAGTVESFNDYEDTTWEDIQAVFGVAIRNARRFGGVRDAD